MERSKEIYANFVHCFGKNGDHKKFIRVQANNFKEPVLIFSENEERLTTNDLKDIGKFLMDVALEIENDNDLKNWG